MATRFGFWLGMTLGPDEVAEFLAAIELEPNDVFPIRFTAAQNLVETGDAIEVDGFQPR